MDLVSFALHHPKSYAIQYCRRPCRVDALRAERKGGEAFPTARCPGSENLWRRLLREGGPGGELRFTTLIELPLCGIRVREDRPDVPCLSLFGGGEKWDACWYRGRPRGFAILSWKSLARSVAFTKITRYGVISNMPPLHGEIFVVN